jgi:outer membrane protein insertion porin family
MDLGADARLVRRAQALALSMALLSLACSRAAPSAAPELDQRELSRRRACAATALPAPGQHAPLPHAEPPFDPIVRIEVLGTLRVSPELVRSTIASQPGQWLERARLADDVRKLWQLEVFEDVSVGWRRDDSGLSLSVRVRERPLVGEVFEHGPSEQIEELGVAQGGLYEPARLHRRARDLERSLFDAGYRHARVQLRGARRAGRIDLCLLVEVGPRLAIDRLEFVGNQRVTAAELRAQMQTEGGTVNTPGAPFRAELVERDLLFLQAIYYDRGMFDARIVPRVKESPRGLEVVLEVAEGVVYRIGALSFTGELAASKQRYRELFGARTGEVCSRQRMMEGVDRIRALHHELGRGDLDVEPKTTFHPTHGRVDIELVLVRR